MTRVIGTGGPCEGCEGCDGYVGCDVSMHTLPHTSKWSIADPRNTPLILSSTTMLCASSSHLCSSSPYSPAVAKAAATAVAAGVAVPTCVLVVVGPPGGKKGNAENAFESAADEVGDVDGDIDGDGLNGGWNDRWGGGPLWVSSDRCPGRPLVLATLLTAPIAGLAVAGSMSQLHPLLRSMLLAVHRVEPEPTSVGRALVVAGTVKALSSLPSTRVFFVTTVLNQSLALLASVSAVDVGAPAATPGLSLIPPASPAVPALSVNVPAVVGTVGAK